MSVEEVIRITLPNRIIELTTDEALRVLDDLTGFFNKGTPKKTKDTFEELLGWEKFGKWYPPSPWSTPALKENTPDPCSGCSNHPKNGGTGICHCTLGLPRITC